jgi:hypothetical protein
MRSANSAVLSPGLAHQLRHSGGDRSPLPPPLLGAVRERSHGSGERPRPRHILLSGVLLDLARDGPPRVPPDLRTEDGPVPDRAALKDGDQCLERPRGQPTPLGSTST